MPDKTMLDAVKESLAPPSDTPASEAPAPEGEAPAKEAPAEEAPAPEEEASVEEAPAEDAPAPEEEAPAEAAVPEGDEPGKEKKPAEAGDEPGKEKTPVAEPDHINDPIPAQVSERTRTRMTSLIDTVKTQATQLQTQQQLFDDITSTGVSADQFANTLTYLRLFHSPKVEDRRAAYKFLVGEVRGLALELGETPPGQDPLDGHQDLIDAVAAQTMTQSHAEELARHRNGQQVQQRHEQQNARAQQQYERDAMAARADLNELGETLAATDPNYQKKYEVLVPKLKAFAATAHPSKWRGWFLKAYKELKLAPVAGTSAPGGNPLGKGPQPLRANKQPAAGGGDHKREPKSLLEAVSGAVKGGG